MKSQNNLQSVKVCYQNFIARKENTQHCSVDHTQKNNRKSCRLKTNGIVVLTSLDRLIVMNVYDIALEGVSFLCANEKDVTDSELTMDILIYDSQVAFEHLISKVKGRVKAREMFLTPESNAPIWRLGVEFLVMDTMKRRMLQTCCSLLRNRSLASLQLFPERIV